MSNKTVIEGLIKDKKDSQKLKLRLKGLLPRNLKPYLKSLDEIQQNCKKELSTSYNGIIYDFIFTNSSNPLIWKHKGCEGMTAGKPGMHIYTLLTPNNTKNKIIGIIKSK